MTHCTTAKLPNLALLLPAAQDRAQHQAGKGYSPTASGGLYRAQSLVLLLLPRFFCKSLVIRACSPAIPQRAEHIGCRTGGC